MGQAAFTDVSRATPSADVRVPLVRGILVGLAAGALALSGYLAMQAMNDGSLAGCGEGAACSDVLTSRWSQWLGVPVSVLAVGVYMALLVAVWRVNPRSERRQQTLAWSVLLLLATVIVGAAAWFVGLMAFEVKARCSYCLAMHGIGLLTAVTIIAYLVSERVRGRRASPIRGEHGVLSVSLGVIGLAGLVGGQFLVENEPKTHRLIRVPYASASSPVEPRPYDSLVEDREHPWYGKRVIQLSLSSAWFVTDDLPVVGSHDAPRLAVLFFDYNCSACRRLHGFVYQALDRYGDQIAFMLAPVPMGSCEAAAQDEDHGHDEAAGASDGCMFARLALAVWRSEPQRFASFDRWLIHEGQLRSVEEAINAGVRLAGRDALSHALDDPWIDERLASNRKAFKMLPKEVGQSRVPVLAMDLHYLAGAPQTESQLFDALERALNLRP